jgi:hypothetical protein
MFSVCLGKEVECIEEVNGVVSLFHLAFGRYCITDLWW